MPRNLAHKEGLALTPMEKAAAEKVAEGMSYTGACREAGYAFPAGEVERLLQKRDFADFVISKMRRDVISWRTLVEKCKRLLNEVLDGAGRVPYADRLKAAAIVMQALKKDKEGLLLADAVEAEDQAETRLAAAKRLLAPMKPPVEN